MLSVSSKARLLPYLPTLSTSPSPETAKCHHSEHLCFLTLSSQCQCQVYMDLPFLAHSLAVSCSCILPPGQAPLIALVGTLSLQNPKAWLNGMTERKARTTSEPPVHIHATAFLGLQLNAWLQQKSRDPTHAQFATQVAIPLQCCCPDSQCITNTSHQIPDPWVKALARLTQKHKASASGTGPDTPAAGQPASSGGQAPHPRDGAWCSIAWMSQRAPPEPLSGAGEKV